MRPNPNRFFPAPRLDRAAEPGTPPGAPRPTLPPPSPAALSYRPPACHAHDYPSLRERPRGAYPGTVEKYERYEELTGAAGTGAAFADLGAFSGTPDAIDLVATGGDALVSLRDNVGREESTLRLIANVPRETHISRRRVFASNVSDLSASTVRATGKWADDYTPDTE